MDCRNRKCISICVVFLFFCFVVTADFAHALSVNPRQLSAEGALYSRNVQHDSKPYSEYTGNKLQISGDGVAKEVTFTVREIEAMTEGKVTATYTMRTLVEPHNGKHEGVSIAYLLAQAGLKSTAKSVRITGEDGVSMQFSVEELTKKTYINEVNTEKLEPILAYSREGKPLVPKETSAGYDKTAENSGGPLRLVIGQSTKEERNSPKFLQNVTKITVSTKEVGVQFTDIGAFYAWTEEAIYSLVEKGVINGVGDGKFAPEKKVTRAEFAKMIGLALGLTPKESATATFTDVKKGDWFYSYVEAAAAKGLIQGVGNQRFDPQGNITRSQICVLAVNALDKKEDAAKKTAANSKFVDAAKIPAWAIGSVVICEEQKLLDNIAVGYFSGDTTINRAEAAVIIYRILEK